MIEGLTMAAKKKTRRAKTEPGSRGLAPAEMRADPTQIEELIAEVEEDGGVPPGPFRDPLDGQWLLLTALPIEQVAPTPYQRDLSTAHLNRLTDVVDKVGLFLDPIIVTREADFALESEEPVLLTLGPCYEKNGRSSERSGLMQ